MEFREEYIQSYLPLIKTLPGPFIVIDKELIIVWTKHDIEGYCGYMPEELIGQNIGVLVKPFFGKSIQALLNEFKENSEVNPFSIKIKPGTTINKIGPKVSYRLSALEWLPSSATIMELSHKFRLIRFNVFPNTIESRLAEFSTDFFLIADENFNIVDFNERIYARHFKILNSRPLAGTPVEKLLIPGDWRRYQKRFSSHTKSEDSSKNLQWQTFFKAASGKTLLSILDFEYEKHFGEDNEELFFSHPDIYSYALIKDTLNFNTNNVKMQCSLRIRGNLTFAFIFGVVKNPYASYLESSGYLVGFRSYKLYIKRAGINVVITSALQS
ncbi:MAG: hypothetical protein ABIA63_07715, partial [bacterium]